MSEQTGRKIALVDFACYVALLVAAVILLINNILPLCGIQIQGAKWMDILTAIQQVAVLVGIAAGAYKFSRTTRSKVYKILYFIAIVIYIVAIVLIFFK